MGPIGILLPWLLSFVGVIMAMPLLTLLERKMLGYIQSRKGPKKVSFMGLLQPISDGGKLILKELGTPKFSKVLLFWLSPLVSFLLMMLSWSLFPCYFSKYGFAMGMMLFLCMASLQVYTLLGSGWGSNSKYTLLGSVRGAAQTMSYEVSMMMMIFLPCGLVGSYNFQDFLYSSYIYMILCLPMFLIWLISMLAETNRSPFDFAEGESELVSGFNMEYAAFEFACLFLSEYGKMILISFVTSLIFFVSGVYLYLLLGMFFVVYFLWVRGSLPRSRYDMLMEMAWKIFLPFSLMYLFFLFMH